MQGNPRQIFVPYNAKIADITHADTNKHTLNLATALSETRKIIAIQGEPRRMAGTGDFRIYPNEGAGIIQNGFNYQDHWTIIANGTQRLQYSLETAGDDYDFYCWGYVVEA